MACNLVATFYIFHKNSSVLLIPKRRHRRYVFPSISTYRGDYYQETLYLNQYGLSGKCLQAYPVIARHRQPTQEIGGGNND